MSISQTIVENTIGGIVVRANSKMRPVCSRAVRYNWFSPSFWNYGDPYNAWTGEEHSYDNNWLTAAIALASNMELELFSLNYCQSNCLRIKADLGGGLKPRFNIEIFDGGKDVSICYNKEFDNNIITILEFPPMFAWIVKLSLTNITTVGILAEVQLGFKS